MTTGDSHSQRQWEQAAAWAEHAMRLPVASVTARRGVAAAAAGRQILARAESGDR
ncbi:hypothetical protein [Prescottella subtropica]|uniref:hypothetical protein n=1 Tax=Prescottella subtropica TaxID=2545757 RepID=UPI0013872149|nr:hypothetical protein [Prescottella subtropica]